MLESSKEIVLKKLTERESIEKSKILPFVNQFAYGQVESPYGSGALAGIEALVKKHPDYKRGKGILVKEYIRTNNKAKLAPLESFLVAEARTDKNLLEPLADLYAMQRMKAKANVAYLELLKANPKDRAVFNKVRKFSSENESPYMGEVLAIALLLGGTLSLSERRASFVSAVTHELRTPLAAILGYAELTRQDSSASGTTTCRPCAPTAWAGCTPWPTRTRPSPPGRSCTSGSTSPGPPC